MSKNVNKHPGISFDQHVQLAVQAAIKNNIKAEVTEATMIVAQETRKALSSIKMRLDALELALIRLGLIKQEDLTAALWTTQETLFGLTTFDGGAEKGHGLRLRVKEEPVGQETDENPKTESYVVLGNSELSPELEEALKGAKAGEVRTLVVEDTKSEVKEGEARPKYLITMAVDRVYQQEKNAQNQI